MKRLVLLDPSDGWHAEVVRGVASSSSRGAGWMRVSPQLALQPGSLETLLEDDVCLVTDVSTAAAIRDHRHDGVTLITVSEGRFSPTHDRGLDETATGEPRGWHCRSDRRHAWSAAVDALRSSGFRHLAHLGDGKTDRRLEEAIEECFTESPAELPTLHAAEQPRAEWLPASPESVDAWIEQLPKPVAVLAIDCRRAEWALASCGRVGLSVPEEVAILSGQDDDAANQLCFPALSSLDASGERVGFEAATLARVLIEGEQPARRVVTVPAGPPKVRASTDILAIGDPDVINALRFIRDSVHQGISVRDILEAVPISRRSLEQKFRASLNRTPADEIRRHRVRRARQLLEDPSLSISDVAAQCGFESCELFSRTFGRIVGIAPSVYRRRTGHARRGPTARPG